MFQPQYVGEPGLLGLAKHFDRHPVIGSTNNSTQGDKEYVVQLV